LKTLKTLGAALCVTALVVPAGAVAQKPDHHGKPATPGVQGKGHAKNCDASRKQPTVGINLRGTVKAGTQTVDTTAHTASFTLVVTKASHHAKKYFTAGQEVVITNAKFKGTALTDGQAVKVLGKIAKPRKKCTATDIASTAKFTKVIAKKPHPETPKKPEDAPKTQS
jgi:hypothetical protein